MESLVGTAEYLGYN